MTVSGNLTNNGQLYTNIQNHVQAGKFNTLTVTGTFTNNAGATTHIGFFNDTTDVMNVATLVNNGVLEIDNGATLNLTAQPNGVTDVASGSQLFVYGTLNAGANNGLAKLGSVEGTLVVGSGQTFTDAPGGGTLTISSSGELDLENFNGMTTAGTNMTVSGNLSNNGQLYTNIQNHVQAGKFNTLTVTGTFTNNSGATTHIGFFGDTTDVMNVATLVNNGALEIDNGATLNLTAQPNGVTDVVAGSQILLYGTLNGGSNHGLAKLQSIEGLLVVGNGQTTNITPTGGTLMISGTNSVLDLENFTGTPVAGTDVTITGGLTNSGTVETNVQDHTPGANKTNTLTVTGTFTNSGTTKVGVFDNTSDVMNVGVLSNSSTGIINVNTGTTFAITNSGTSTNNGTIDVGDTSGAGTLKINNNVTLTGTTGKVILSNFAGNIIGGTGTLTNVKNTISGSGHIGNGTLGLNNQGTIDANQSVPLIINAAGI